jgi:hypothetical protein
MKFYRLNEVPFLYNVVSFELTSVEVRGETRRLRAAWTPQMVQDIQYMMTVDAENELNTLLTEQVGEFAPRQSIAARYATRMVDRRFYGTIEIIKAGVKFPAERMKFGRLKRMPWHDDDAFQIVQFPIARRVEATLIGSEPRIDVVENNDGGVYTSLRQWAELIDRSNQPIILSSRRRG